MASLRQDRVSQTLLTGLCDAERAGGATLGHLVITQSEAGPLFKAGCSWVQLCRSTSASTCQGYTKKSAPAVVLGQQVPVGKGQALVLTLIAKT